MHILVVNDDGPPGDAAPFVLPLVKALKAAGHDVSVCLPHVQRSWIGKSHMITDRIELSYYDPASRETRDDPSEGADWVLVNSTPATATQIGLFHAFKDMNEIDLVVSGPNFGRNSTAIFAMSSGTLGAAMEAAVCGVKAIALSYAYKTPKHNWDIVNTATDVSVRLIEYLYRNGWPDGTPGNSCSDNRVDVFSINVPLEENIANAKIVYTHILQNRWLSGSCFDEVTEDEKLKDAEQREIEIRRGEGKPSAEETHVSSGTGNVSRKRTFKWAPKFKDVYKTVELAGEGTNDGWIVKEGMISVTPLKANFMHVPGITGEIKLSGGSERPTSETTQLHAIVNYSDDREYVEPLIRRALRSNVPSLQLLGDTSELPSDAGTAANILTWSSYESIDFESLLSYPRTQLANSYVIRKALIRKHYLSSTASSFLSKRPDSVLRNAIPFTSSFEVDYAEFLDEALVEEYELLESLEKNQEREESEKEWWILKPGMSDRGMGIRLFSSMEELQAIFESFEGDDEDEENDDGGDGDESRDKPHSNTGVITSQLRHFVAQRYIDPPLMLKPKDDSSRYHKFHIRTYVLAVGALEVYVYKPMLALFAAKPYAPPKSPNDDDEGEVSLMEDLSAHLTNTCLQDGVHDGNVRVFWKLGEHYDVPSSSLEDMYGQICSITSDLFRAAVSGGRVNFQPLPNAFEIFGLDFVVDDKCGVKLLEVNAFPDFKQTGQDLKEIIEGLFDGVVKIAIVPFFRKQGVGNETSTSFDKVLDLDVGRF